MERVMKPFMAGGSATLSATSDSGKCQNRLVSSWLANLSFLIMMMDESVNDSLHTHQIEACILGAAQG